MRLNLSLAFAVLLFHASLMQAGAQCDVTGHDIGFTLESDELPYVLPDGIQRELVFQALGASVAPTKDPTEISVVARGLVASWLPPIANVRWRIVDPDARQALEDQCQKYYFFTTVDELNGRLQLGLAYGDTCSAWGTNYSFCRFTGAIDSTRSTSGFGYNSSHCGKPCTASEEQPN